MRCQALAFIPYPFSLKRTQVFSILRFILRFIHPCPQFQFSYMLDNQEPTQSFRLTGTNIEGIRCDYVNGHHVIFWETIEITFMGVQHILSGGVVVDMFRDSNQRE